MNGEMHGNAIKKIVNLVFFFQYPMAMTGILGIFWDNQITKHLGGLPWVSHLQENNQSNWVSHPHGNA